MLQNPSVIAAKTSGCDVYLFDCSKHPVEGEDDSCCPDLVLKGHEKEGYGLSWSPFKEGYLLSDSIYYITQLMGRPRLQILEDIFR